MGDLIKRADVTVPVVPTRQEPYPPLGGDVMVRGLGLIERLSLRPRLKGEEGEQSDPMAIVPVLLAMSVVDADGKPVADAAGWNALGASHVSDTLRLFEVAMELSGLDIAVEKKS